MFSVQQQTPTIDDRFGELVSAARQLRRFSQREFAAILTELGMPVDASAVSRIEAGTRSVRLREAEVIANALAMSLAALLESHDRTPKYYFLTSRSRLGLSLARAREPIVNVLMWTQDLMAKCKSDPTLLELCEGAHPPKDWREVPRWIVENYLPTREDPSVGLDDFAQFNDEEERDLLIDFMARVGGRLTEPVPRREDSDGEHPEAS